MRVKGVMRGKGRYILVSLVLIILIGAISFSSRTAEAWDAEVEIAPQEVYTGESTEISIKVENTGTEPMKVYVVAISFRWQEEGKEYTLFEGEKVISPGDEATFTGTIEIPGGIQTNTRYDRETTILASDPDGYGGWRSPYEKNYSGRIQVSESDDIETGTIALILIIIISVIVILLAFALGRKDEEKNQPSQQYQQTGQQSPPPQQQQSAQRQPQQQQASVPPTSQSSQQSEGGPSQQAQQSSAPPSPKKCPSCNAEMRYVDEQDSWWCDRCQEYK